MSRRVKGLFAFSGLSALGTAGTHLTVTALVVA